MQCSVGKLKKHIIGSLNGFKAEFMPDKTNKLKVSSNTA